MAELNIPVAPINVVNTVSAPNAASAVSTQSDNFINLIMSKVNSKYLYLYIIGLAVIIGCVFYYYYKMKTDVIQVLSGKSGTDNADTGARVREAFKQNLQMACDRKDKYQSTENKIDIAEIIKPHSKMKQSSDTHEIIQDDDMEFIDIDDQLSSYESESDEDIETVQLKENDVIKQQNLSQRDLIDINKQLKSMNKKKTI
jgi:hypothetical protein